MFENCSLTHNPYMNEWSAHQREIIHNEWDYKVYTVCNLERQTK